MRILVINNLRAGHGDTGFYEFLREIGLRGAEVSLRFLNPGSDLAVLLRDAHEHDRVVAVGGDGTISAVAYALRDTGVPIVAYPAGTANLYARSLGMPADPGELASITMNASADSFDIGEMEFEGDSPETPGPTGFCVIAGAGFAAAIMESAHELKDYLGEGAYMVGVLQNVQPTRSRFTIEVDGVTHVSEGIAVLFVNLARIQFDLAVTHESDARDGVMEVVVVNTANVVGLLPALWAALLDRIGDHPHRPALEIHRAREARVSADPPLAIQYDGEALPATTPVTARILHRAATFVVPSGYRG